MIEQEPQDRQQGVVKWFSDPKGYGFILREEDADIFVHHTAIQMDGFRTLKEGDMVMYDLTESTKGLQAANVTPMDAEGQPEVQTESEQESEDSSE